jgi:hypothetical protein
MKYDYSITEGSIVEFLEKDRNRRGIQQVEAHVFGYPEGTTGAVLQWEHEGNIYQAFREEGDRGYEYRVTLIQDSKFANQVVVESDEKMEYIYDNLG